MRYQTVIGNDIDVAISYLEGDALVGLPTETVYGLAANAFSEKAVASVFAVKQRPANNPLIVHVDRIAEVKQLVQEMPEMAEALLEHFAPGPITVLLKKNALLPPNVTAGRFEVAIRIPSHPQTLELLRRIDFPLVMPSANLHTTISPTHPQHVLKNFYGAIPYILDGGPCEVGLESTIVGFDPDGVPVIYRQGAITEEEIRLVTGAVRVKGMPAGVTLPGSAPLHYAPRTRTFLVSASTAVETAVPHRTGVLSFKNYHPGIPQANQFILSNRGDLREAARNLYRGLHHLDEQNFDLIIAEECPPQGLGRIINERLRRAAHPEPLRIA